MIKCSDCGRFISYAEIESGKIDNHYHPDTPFNSEEISYSHKKCEKEVK